MTTPPDKKSKPLLFVDASGGALAAMGAGIAHALGHADAAAATIVAVGTLPVEVSTVLEEVGMTAASARAFDEAAVAGFDVVWLDVAPPPASLGKARVLACKLLAPDAEEFGRLATARIVRDRIERLVANGSG
jgi:hypothetical protein